MNSALSAGVCVAGDGVEALTAGAAPGDADEASWGSFWEQAAITAEMLATITMLVARNVRMFISFSSWLLESEKLHVRENSDTQNSVRGRMSAVGDARRARKTLLVYLVELRSLLRRS